MRGMLRTLTATASGLALAVALGFSLPALAGNADNTHDNVAAWDAVAPENFVNS